MTTITTKVNHVLGFFKTEPEDLQPKAEVKAAACRTLVVRHLFKYTSPVWNLYFKQHELHGKDTETSNKMGLAGHQTNLHCAAHDRAAWLGIPSSVFSDEGIPSHAARS
ncbi:hypothetical protein ACOMHN_013865 [Nucella lapillus]